MKDLLALPTMMSSREIATLLDVRHDNVKRTIERLAEKTIISFTPTEETSLHFKCSTDTNLFR